MQKLIAKYISDRYRFIDTSTGEVTAFTDDLIGIAAGVNPAALNTASPRDNTLRQSIEYLRAGSGLYATLFKTFKLWGDGADERLLKYLYDDYAYLYKAKLQMGRDKSKMREIQKSTLWMTTLTAVNTRSISLSTMRQEVLLL